jgi:hypothetical protein
MALDFVMEHESERLLLTEAEKVSYFCAECGLSPSELPTRTYSGNESEKKTQRFFIEKQPILISQPASAGAAPVVTFSFVDEGLHSTKGFEAFLSSYRPLMLSIPCSRLVYVACSPVQIPVVRRIFDRAIAGGNPGANLQRLASFFADREAYERRDFATFSQQKLIRFREEKACFADQHFEQLFGVWRDGGLEALLKHLSDSEATATTSNCEFRSMILPHKYELFGTLAGNEWVP